MLINVAESEECRVAVVEDGTLEELYVERASLNSHVGNIYKGKVANIESGIQAAFIDFGVGKNGFLHISDLSRACLLTLEKYANSDPINIGYGEVVTIKEIVNIILKSTGYSNADIIFDSSKPTTIPFRMVDTEKAKNKLTFEPRISLEEGLMDTAKWYAQMRAEQKIGKEKIFSYQAF